MNIEYSNRSKTLLQVYDVIEKACTNHPAISSYEVGDEQEFNGSELTFAMAYLETINDIQENENKRAEVYNISLNILDRVSHDSTSHDKILIHGKIKQVFTEIKCYLEWKFGTKNVSEAQIIIFNGYTDTDLIRLRADFTIHVEMITTEVADLKILYNE